MDLRTSAAVCKRSRKLPQSGKLGMHELRSGPATVKGLRRRGRTDRQKDTHELKGSELYPLSERMGIYIYIYIAGLAGLAGLAWQGAVKDRGSREEVWRRGEGGYSVAEYQ